MIARIGAQIAAYLLKKGTLSIEDANKITFAILDNFGASPIRDIIEIGEEGKLLVKGKVLSLEELKRLRTGAVSALENQTLRFVREQVAFAAISHGVHKAETPAQIFFARAALWYHQESLKLLETLAQRTELPVEED